MLMEKESPEIGKPGIGAGLFVFTVLSVTPSVWSFVSSLFESFFYLFSVCFVFYLVGNNGLGDTSSPPFFRGFLHN